MPSQPVHPQSAPMQVLPPTQLLLADYQDGAHRMAARRLGGTRDWLFILTHAGRMRFASSSAVREFTAGEALLVRPNTPQDYEGLLGPDGRWWVNSWVHFQPRGHWLEWLRWPEFAPGCAAVTVDAATAAEVASELERVRRWAVLPAQAAPLAEMLAVNALERALMLCTAAARPAAGAGLDPRIQRAVGLLCADLRVTRSLDEIARASGLSRSRFTQLFRQYLGVAPGEFLAEQRLLRVRALLAGTQDTLEAIAEATGFTTPFYLSLCFKRRFQVSPREYRRSLGGLVNG